MTEQQTHETVPPFVAEYERFVASLPHGNSREDVPGFDLMPTEDRRVAEAHYAVALSEYANKGNRVQQSTSAETTAPRPFPPGFIHPGYTDTVQELIVATAVDGTSSYAHNYEPARPGGNSTGPSDGERRRVSREWESFYAGYVGVRHEFHLRFLQVAAGLDTTSPRESYELASKQLAGAIEGSRQINGGRSIMPEKILSYPEWMIFSLANVLFADPDTVSADFQQRALRLFTANMSEADFDTVFSEADPTTAGLSSTMDSLQSIGDRDNATVVSHRLPSSFVTTAEEAEATTHPDWRKNERMVEIFGEPRDPSEPYPPEQRFVNGCNQLMLEQPEDLMQVLLLYLTAGEFYERKSAARALHMLGRLTPDMLNRVVYDEASYRILHHHDPQAAVRRRRERAFGVPGEATTGRDPVFLEGLLAASDERINVLSQQVLGLRQQVVAQTAILAALGAGITPKQAANAEKAGLLAEYGIDPSAPPEVIKMSLSGLRIGYSRLYHPDFGTQPDEETLQRHNGNLEEIARSLGI